MGQHDGPQAAAHMRKDEEHCQPIKRDQTDVPRIMNQSRGGPGGEPPVGVDVEDSAGLSSAELGAWIPPEVHGGEQSCDRHEEGQQ